MVGSRDRHMEPDLEPRSGLRELFLAEYRVGPDADRMHFYRLLYDLAC